MALQHATWKNLVFLAMILSVPTFAIAHTSKSVSTNGQAIETLYMNENGEFVPKSELSKFELEALSHRMDFASEEAIEARELVDRVHAMKNAGITADEIWESLLAEEQDIVRDVFAPVKLEIVFNEVFAPDNAQITLDQNSPHPDAYFRAVYVGFVGYGSYGVRLWEYGERLDWWYDYVRIVSENHYEVQSVYSLFWRYLGNEADQHLGGVGYTAFWPYTKGEFAYCLAWCIQYSYPWVEIRANNNGSYTYRYGL